MKVKQSSNNCTHGFTLLEILIVIAIIGVLMSIVVMIIPSQQEKIYLSTAKQNLAKLERAANIYLVDNQGDYPADVDRDVPPGLDSIITQEGWPGATWPSSVYDWDNWEIDGEQIIQISIRFCDYGDPSSCQFPRADWADDFDYHSSVYWCIRGPCRAHNSQAIDHPGYCANCDNQ